MRPCAAKVCIAAHFIAEIALMGQDGTLIDRGTQRWVRATGRLVDFADHPWLRGPVGDPDVIGDTWVDTEIERLGGRRREGGGLLASMADLASDTFDPHGLGTSVTDFYEQTSDWRLEVWSQWSLPAWPLGWLLTAAFATRLEQLSLPLRPLETSRGMDSRVIRVVDDGGRQLGAAWLRTLRSSGRMLYSGWYGTAVMPATGRPSVRVAFPLPNGSVTVFLRPEVDDCGGLRLVSPLSTFGDDGAYLIVARRDRQAGWVRRVPLAEAFAVYVDEDGVLRADHALDLGSVPVIRFHYRLDRAQ